MDAPDILTVAECAGLLRCDVKTVYRAIEQGDLPALRLGRSLRISKKALVSLMEPHDPTNHDPDGRPNINFDS